MIRAGLPMPAFHRLAFHTQAIASRWRRNAARANLIMSNAITLQIPDRILARRRHQAASDIARSAALLPAYEERFEELVDILCWSAKEGDHTGRDERYQALRKWLLGTYDRFRPGLIHFLTVDAGTTLVTEARLNEPRDVFESLFLPVEVSANIHSESTIERIGRSRAAIEAFRAHVGHPDD